MLKRYLITLGIIFLGLIVWSIIADAFPQQRKAFWDTDKLTNSETIYSHGSGLFITAIPVEIKYQTDGIHIIWQLNQIFRGRIVPIVWKEVSNWDMNKKEFVVVRKEAYTKSVNPQVSIDEFTPVPIKKDTVDVK